jgi:predicted small lipoprotein YifL
VIEISEKRFTQRRRDAEVSFDAPGRKNKKKEWCANARKFALEPWRLGGFPLRLCASACKTNGATTILRVIVALALMMPVAACGTKTELLMPNGKPTPRDQRDPSQPPSPISR